MKRTVSMAVLGVAMASTSALASVYNAPPDRAARQQERAAEGRGNHGNRSGPRSDAPRDAGPRQRGPRQDGPREDGPRPDAPRGGDSSRDDGARGLPQSGGAWRGNDRRDDRHYGNDRDPRPRSYDPRAGGRNDGDRRGWRDERGRDWHNSRDWYDRYRADHFRYDRGRYVARQRFSIGIYFVPRGYAPRYWQRGQWLPASYYAERRHHLADYWRFDLYDPPYFAHWVRVGSDALLVDLDSGEVLDVVFELFW